MFGAQNATSFIQLPAFFFNLRSSPYFLHFSSSNIDDRNSSPTEEQEEQEDEEEQEERLEDIFPNNFEALDVEGDDSSANHEERKPPVSNRNSVPACDFNDNNYSLTCAVPYIFPLG
jgi:hypothetical protein